MRRKEKYNWRDRQLHFARLNLIREVMEEWEGTLTYGSSILEGYTRFLGRMAGIIEDSRMISTRTYPDMELKNGDSVSFDSPDITIE